MALFRMFNILKQILKNVMAFQFFKSNSFFIVNLKTLKHEILDRIGKTSLKRAPIDRTGNIIFELFLFGTVGIGSLSM